jgi:hypothetical protein
VTFLQRRGIILSNIPFSGVSGSSAEVRSHHPHHASPSIQTLMLLEVRLFLMKLAVAPLRTCRGTGPAWAHALGSDGWAQIPAPLLVNSVTFLVCNMVQQSLGHVG